MSALYLVIVIIIYAGKLALRVGRQGQADRHVRLVWPTYQLCWEV